MATLSASHPALYFQTATITNSKDSFLEELYVKYREVIFRVALRVTRNVDDAEDVVQNVFLRMMRNDTQPDVERSPGAYLKRAATNASIDLIRQRTQRAETTIPAHQAAMEEEWVERRHVQQAIEKLPAENAELFTLHYRDGYMCHEVANRLEMQTGTVKSRLHRIRTALQKQLKAA